jgi:hypothetical protein
VLFVHTTCGREQWFVQADLAGVNQVKVIRQIVRIWSNTHRGGAPLLKAPAPTRAAGSEIPQGIDTVNTSVVPRSAQQREWPNELPLSPLTDDEIPQSRDVARVYGRDPQADESLRDGDASRKRPRGVDHDRGSASRDGLGNSLSC